MPQASPIQEQLEFYLSVDKLISAAEQVRRQRDRLLDAVRSNTGESSRQKAEAILREAAR